MEEKEKNAPIALFMFAAVIVFPLLIAFIIGFSLIFVRQSTLEQKENNVTLLEEQELTTTPTPTVKETVTPTETPTPKTYYYNTYPSVTGTLKK